MGIALLVVKYWPAVVAGLYLLYVVAAAAGGPAGAVQAGQIPQALTAFVAALGLSQGVASAHAKIDKL